MSDNKYLKFDELNGFLENEDDINYFKANQIRKVAEGNMLGDFNEKGEYVLDKEIVTELINMPKVIVDSVEGVDLICGAVKFDNFIHFMLNIADDKAQLILLEKINFEGNSKFNSGSYFNMNEYVLSEIEVHDRDVDKNFIYAKFNIFRQDKGIYHDFKELTDEEMAVYQNIVKKMKYNYLVQNQIMDKEAQIEEVNANYFDEILEVFSEYPKLKSDLEKILDTVMAEKREFLIINLPFFQSTINEVLDNWLGVLLSKLPPKIRAEIEKKIRAIKNKYFIDFTNLIHIQYINSNGVEVKHEDKNIISKAINQDAETTKISRIEVKQEDLYQSLSAIMNANEKIKTALQEKNANSTNLTKKNPHLTEFYKNLKKDAGVDLLKPEGESIVQKAVEKTSKNNAKSQEKKFETSTKKSVTKEAPTKKAGPSLISSMSDAKPQAKKETEKATKKETEKKATKSKEAKTTESSSFDLDLNFSSIGSTGTRTPATRSTARSRTATSTNNTATPTTIARIEDAGNLFDNR